MEYWWGEHIKDEVCGGYSTHDREKCISSFAGVNYSYEIAWQI